MGNDVEKTNGEQIQRFKDTAREIGAYTSDDALDKVMGKLFLKKKPDSGEKKTDAKKP